MNIKNIKFHGFTLIELMVASTIATIVLVLAFSLIGNIYFTKKRINISKNFYNESRFLLEKIVTIARENTIDYDRYFEEVGPNSTNCHSFDNDQIVFAKTKNGSVNRNNDTDNRKNLTYPNIFYWEISDDIYRNLGGTKPTGSIDSCAQAFHGTLNVLYLINEKRTIRTAIKLENGRIQTSVELGADTDSDGKADSWSSNSIWTVVTGGACKFHADGAPNIPTIPTLITNSRSCYQAHDWQDVSAKNLQVSSFNFTPYPDRDPYLNFRNDDVQIHPNVFLYMKIDLADFEKYGFENQPTITMQTGISSRIYENNRK